MKPVLFTSNKPLERAENIKAVYDAWEDGKVFIRTEPGRHMPGLSSDEYALRVCDEFIGESPGKAVMIGHGIAGSKTYGDADPELTYTADGFKRSDTKESVMSGALERAAGEDVGDYAISQGTVAAGNNYTISYSVSMMGVTKTIKLHRSNDISFG